MSVNPFFDYFGPSAVEPLVSSDLSGLFIHTVDVEQETDGGVDDAGTPVPQWANVYTGLACSVIPLNYAEVLDWQQRGVTASHKCYVPPQTPEGVLPTIMNRCRLAFGTRPDSTTRYLSVVHGQDVSEAGVLLELLLYEAFPGGR